MRVSDLYYAQKPGALCKALYLSFLERTGKNSHYGMEEAALQITLEPTVEPGREVIRILAIGPARGVERIVHELF